MSSKPASLDVPRVGNAWAASTASTIAGDDLLHEKAHHDVSSSNEDNYTEKTTQSIASSHTDEAPEEEYPSGMKMFFIVVALVFSIFLLALDMVCSSTNTALKGITKLTRY